MKNYQFPQYRKYATQTSYFRIESEQKFTEIQLIGSSKMIHHIEAKILPDFQRIQDMLEFHNAHWIESTEGEFDQLLND